MPDTAAVVHAKGTSNRVPGKNLRLLGDRPLFCWAIDNALASRAVDVVYIDSESETILRIGADRGAQPLRRPAALADNNTTGDDLAIWQAQAIPGATVIAQVVPTSPFVRPETISRGIAMLSESGVDSVVGVRVEPCYRWTDGHPDYLRPEDPSPTATPSSPRSARRPGCTSTGARRCWRAGGACPSGVPASPCRRSRRSTSIMRTTSHSPSSSRPGCSPARQKGEPMRCMLVATDPGAPARPTFPEVPGAIEVGRTDRAVVHVDAVMGGRGRRIAEANLDSVEEEIDSIAEHFGNLELPDLPLNVVVAQLPGVERAYHHAASSADLFIDARTMPAIEPRYSRFLLSTQLVDLFLDASGRAWSPGDSHGEALSRALATSAYPRQISGFATAAGGWTATGRIWWQPGVRSGRRGRGRLGVLFLNWLHFQLGHLWEDIIACAAATLAESYYRLVGDAEDAFAAFSREVEAIYPAGRPSELATDNPFPRARPVPAEDAVAAREAPAEPAIPSVDDAEPSSAEEIDAAAEETWSGEGSSTNPISLRPPTPPTARLSGRPRKAFCHRSATSSS